jgi:hypothetical protein
LPFDKPFDELTVYRSTPRRGPELVEALRACYTFAVAVSLSNRLADALFVT